MKYFGTDGIRGEANVELTFDLAYRTGYALGTMLGEQVDRRPLVYIGRDTRISGGMLEAALTAGLCNAGADVTALGIMPTPAVAWLTAHSEEADAGIVISASHNPFADNGIKIFGGQGFKLTDAQEDRIEALIDAPTGMVRTGAELGMAKAFEGGNPVEAYVRHIADTAPCRLIGMRVAVDCANGAASSTAESLFRALGADAVIVNAKPDGININEGCGSTHIEGLQEMMKTGRYAIGCAFDGDADRCLLVDEKGQVIDGDHIIGILADHMKRSGKLKGGVVGTILTNLGLHAYLEGKNIPVQSTKVGDRYVLERMRAEGWNIGGEQSGHVILSDHASTGDGQLTAIQFLCAMKMSGKSASELNGMIESFPQVAINVAAPNKVKHLVAELPEVIAVGEEIKAAFNGAGRVVIRPSGTEPKVRVMVEGRDKAMVEELAKKAADVVKAAVEGL